MPACPSGRATASRAAADGSLRETGGAATAQQLLDSLDEETALYIILGYDGLHGHDSRLSLRLGCGLPLRRARLHVWPPRLPGPHARRASLAGTLPMAGRVPSASQHRRAGVGLGEVLTLGRASVCPPLSWAGAALPYFALAAVVSATWAEDTLAGLADSSTTHADGTVLLVGQISFAADGPALTLPVDDGDRAATPRVRRAGRLVRLRAREFATRPASTPWSGIRAAHRDWYASDATLAADEALVAGRARRVAYIFMHIPLYSAICTDSGVVCT